ncbi:MAG: hypothetical protein HYV18_01005 [Gammaproteobacteria bacterium]|nr:hypothetical protein [Gammaproteobacteria bacterium]
MAGKKAAPANSEDLADEAEGEGWEDESAGSASAKAQATAPGVRLRDWRDVEKYREMKELRRQVDDDFGLDEAFGAHAERLEQAAHKAAETPKPGKRR